MALRNSMDRLYRRSLLQRSLSLMVWGVLSLGMLHVLGCSSIDSDRTPAIQPSTETADSPASPLTDNPDSMPSTQLGQQLPISAMAEIGGHEILLEVAQTPQQQAMGLMFRDPLPDRHGMLFPMGRPRPVSFWMKNVPVPLDMVFIYNGTIQAIAANVPPCQTEPCPTYGPGGQLVDHVIELRGGHAAELGLTVGDTVVVSPISP